MEQQGQEKKQIPCGNDRKKSEGNSKRKGSGNGPRLGVGAGGAGLGYVGAEEFLGAGLGLVGDGGFGAGVL